MSLINKNPRSDGGLPTEDYAKPSLNPQELATVLAALRYYQRGLDPCDLGDYYTPAWHFDDVKPLTNSQIDSLCERLNTEGLKS